MKSLSMAVSAAMLCCGGLAAEPVSYEDGIPAFREGVDAYRVQQGARGAWRDGKFTVSVPCRHEFTMTYVRYPGMKPFRGADEIVLASEFDGLGDATAELVLFEFSGGGREMRKFHAPLARETRFKTRLDPAKKYQLGNIGIHRAQKDGSPWKIGFASLRGVFKTPKAEALRIEAETGNPLHIVREGRNEKPMLVIRNAASERVVVRGTLNVVGFCGDKVDVPVDVALDGGERAEIPVCGTVKKGVWRISGNLDADDGSVANVDTRFAVMDWHDKSPKQPMGTFRLGVLWHIERFTPADRRLSAAAMVACGAKLTRADIAYMSSIQRDGPDCWDFARTDELMETLEANGLSLDAIIFNTPKWAAEPERRTNSNWRVSAFSRPLHGAFERFCERLAARYGTRIDYYEIGNEWDLQFKGSFEDAVAIQREAYAGLKRGCPGVCVVPNGWANVRDGPHITKSGRPGLREFFLENAKEWFDVTTIHCHAAFTPYVNFIKKGFFPLCKRTGISHKPWFSNETALTSVWSERNTALAVWKKILWTWANGSVDYIWYNLKGTGWNPKDSEQGYGLMTADFLPRDSYVAFAALASVVGGGRFMRTILDDGSRYIFEFSKGNALVLTAWNESASSERHGISVRTDAKRAWHVDLMGNRSEAQMESWKVKFAVSQEPSALVLDGATVAEADVAELRAGKSPDDTAILIPPEKPGRPPDFVLCSPDQVHDFFEGNPAEVKRLWKGPKDNSAKVWLSKTARGLRIRVEAVDDVQCQPYDGAAQYQGDDVQVAFAVPGQNGQWEFGFARRDDGRFDVHCWIAPLGFNAGEAAAWLELCTERCGDVTRYDALIPYAESRGYTAKTLEDGLRFNLMLNDNDGDGRDATIEIVPNTFHSKDMSVAPAIRFGK